MLRRAFLLFVLAALPAACLTPDEQATVGRITEDSLRGHLRFLASDLLEGRGTPSPGLEIAAEYIAAQFDRAGLEPAGGDGYFQTSAWTVSDAAPRRLKLVEDGDTSESGQRVQLRNVIGLLRGSDPLLRDTYVIVSAHYDHTGIGTPVNGDSIYNGANDDASGAVALIEIASALRAAPLHPARSILFVAFFGEERGLLGSRYYAAHPAVPLDRTVADINLEQVGRTDSTTGPKVNSANLTGFTYSTVPAVMAEAASRAGIRIWGDPDGDSYFARSDNAPLAAAGIPSHTLSVAYDFPGYHQPDDEWNRIDYANMAKVVRGVALGILALADLEPPPDWNAANPKTERYRKAQANNRTQ